MATIEQATQSPASSTASAIETGCFVTPVAEGAERKRLVIVSDNICVSDDRPVWVEIDPDGKDGAQA